jgi:hypothetical protein
MKESTALAGAAFIFTLRIAIISKLNQTFNPWQGNV